jgi:hypothetical protein
MTKSTDQNHFHDQPLWAIDALSADRLSHYLVQENGDLTRAVLRYKENLSWSADLYQWLALAEVVLRNALISSLTPKMPQLRALIRSFMFGKTSGQKREPTTKKPFKGC